MTNRFFTCAVMALATLSLAACSTAPRGGRDFRSSVSEGSRERPRLAPVGDPGRVAATDIAFAHDAREEGQWTAFARYAGSAALIHGANGPIEAAPWLAAQTNPARSVQWSPTAVWASCDGTLAVSFGRYSDPDGTVGSYTTVWQVQHDGHYKWIYDMGGPDVPQPPAPPPPPAPSIDVIVVPALESIDGKVADCVRDGSPPPPATVSFVAGTDEGGGRSDDGSLAWHWTQQADGTRRVAVNYMRGGEWAEAMSFTVPPTGQ